MNPTEKLFPSSHSLNFPESTSNEYFRENIITTISKTFDSGKNVVLIDGEEGLGKTTILKQFAAHFPATTFASFINPVRGLASPDDFVLHDLYAQLQVFAGISDGDSSLGVDEEKFLDMLYYVERMQKMKRVKCYFVIDGLEYIHEDNLIKKILRLVPIGITGIKMLASDTNQYVQAKLARTNTIDAFTLPLYPFTIEEMKIVFSKDTSLADEDWRGVWQASNNGVPGKLKDIFRILQESGRTVKELFDDLDQISVIYEIDWKRLEAINNNLLNQITALIALDDRIYTRDYLSKVLDVSELDILESVRKVSFLTCPQNGEVQFTSNSNRSFFARKMTSYKHTVEQLNIQYLLKNQDSLEALTHLPKYYASSSNYDGVLNILSGDYFSKLIDTAQTLTSASVSLSIGFLAAKKSGADAKLFDFALYGSLIENVEGLHIWKSELEARIELGDYDKAIGLANRALLQEDRLKFLARIARIKKKRSELIEPALLEQIDHLFKNLDVKNLGKKAIDIASDLFYVNPALALSMIQDSTANQNQNVNNWLLSKLTLAAIESKETVDSEKVSALVTGHQAKEFSVALGEIFGSYDFERIVEELGKLKGQREKILLLRLWIINNEENFSLGAAITLSLDLMVQDNSKEFADASLLADLVEHLHLVKDNTQIPRILERCAQFKDEAKALSYTVDYFRFVTFAVRAKVKFHYDFAMGWLFELQKDLDAIQDKVIKAESLSILNNSIIELKSFIDAKRHGYLFATLNSTLKNLVINICDSSAYHYENLKDVVFQLARFDVGFAAEMSLRANTSDRRDWLLYRTFEGYVEYNVRTLKLETIKRLFSLINDMGIQDLSLQALLQKITAEKIEKIDKDITFFIFKQLQQVKSLQMQSYLQCLFAIYLSGSQKDGVELKNPLYNALSKSWSALDSEVEQIEIGFLISSMLATVDRDIANEYLVRADSLRKTIWPDSLNTVTIYSIYAQLLIKAFSGLIKDHKYSDTDYRKLIEIVNGIPSPIARIQLWNYLATIAHVKGDVNLRSKTFDEFIKPTFDAFADKNQQDTMLVDCSHLFYLNNPIITLNRLDGLPRAAREVALKNVIHFILHERIPHEPYEPDDKGFRDRLTQDDLKTVCELTGKLEIDVHIYSCVEKVVRACMNIKATPVQKDDLRKDLLKIIGEKLPNQKYIKHPGYKIIALAQLLRFEKEAAKQEKQLEILMAEIETSVPNLSDKAFIYTTIGDIAPSLKVTKYSKSLFISKSLELIDLLDFSLESAYRTEFLLKKLRETNVDLWKQRLTKEFKKTVKSYHSADALELQRRLLDHAYRHDATFAKKLVELLDDEEVRMEYRRKKHLTNYFETLQLKRQIYDDKIIADKQSAALFAEACEGSLAALNSNKIGSKKASDMRYYLDYAIKLPTTTAFDIYKFYIQNIVKRFEGKSEGPELFGNLLNSIYGVCKFIQLIVQRYKQGEAARINKIDLADARRKVFKAGEREKALNFIRAWLNDHSFTYVKICDPFFSPHELFILRDILEISKTSDVFILTSVEGKHNGENDVSSRYSSAWKEISHEDPAFVKISIVKVRRTNKTPVHDRWILTDKAGLDLGTSLNGLGIDKASQITELDLTQKTAIETDIFDPLFEPKRKDFNGERTDNLSFTLL